MATNSMMISLASKEESNTSYSMADFAARVAVMPVTLVGGLIIETIEKDKPESELLSTAAKVGIFAATVPQSLLLSAILTPLLVGVEVTESNRKIGDLTPVSEDEDM